MSKFYSQAFWWCLAVSMNTLLGENMAQAIEPISANSAPLLPVIEQSETVTEVVPTTSEEVATQFPEIVATEPVNFSGEITPKFREVNPSELSANVISSSPENPETFSLETVEQPVLQSDRFNAQSSLETLTPETLAQVNSTATPAPETPPNQELTNAMGQVTSVSQLSDVQPTDWAFQALQSLVERYGCIAGYPDGTYRGNRALTRYEFAAGLNACLDQVTRQIGAATANYITKEDLAILQRLQEEFAAELAALRGRIDALEARTAELEANQFSTNTKLNAETILGISDTFGDGAVEEDETVTNFGYRIRLNFDTSFTGQDRLRTRLQARNNARYDRFTGTPMTRTNFDGDDGSQFTLNKLSYLFPLGRSTTVEIGAVGLTSDDVAPLINPYLDSSAQGALSRFGAFNPAIYNTPGETGIAINHLIGEKLNITLSYLANTAANPTAGNGLFDGSYGAIAQLTYSPSSSFDIALSYVRTYYRKNDVDLSLGTGSNNANQPFDQNATRGNHYGLQFSWRPSSRFALSSWVGYVDAKQLSNGDAQADVWNGGITLAFPDLFKPGNLGGIIVGVPPKVTNNDFEDREDSDTSLHVEALYRFQVNDFISVTPGFYFVTNTNHNADNGTTWVGVLRTSFNF